MFSVSFYFQYKFCLNDSGDIINIWIMYVTKKREGMIV